MTMNTNLNTISYKKTLIGLGTLTMVRTGRFYDENEVLVPCNGKKLLTNYQSDAEY